MNEINYEIEERIKEENCRGRIQAYVGLISKKAKKNKNGAAEEQ